MGGAATDAVPFGHHGGMTRAVPDPPGSEARAVVALRELVGAFEPRTAREVASKARFATELDRLPHPFRRTADPVHVTGSALVVGRRGIVLHVHKKLGRWLQPGGHIEEGEAPHEAALREAVEETGLEVAQPPAGPQLVHLDVHPAGAHVHLDLRYLLLAGDEDPAPAPGESPRVRWFRLSEATEVADEALVDALARLRVGPAGIEPATEGL